MIVSIIFDRLDQALRAKAKLFLHLSHNLQVYSLKVSHCSKALGFWLMQLIPRMLSDFIHTYSLLRIRYENLGYKILSLFT